MIKNILDHSLRYLERERYSWSELLAIQKNRKKIFTEYSRSKSKSINSDKKQIKSYTDLSSTKYHQTIPKS